MKQKQNVGKWLYGHNCNNSNNFTIFLFTESKVNYNF